MRKARNSLQDSTCAHCGWSCPHDVRSLREGIPPRAMSEHLIANKDDPNHAALRRTRRGAAR